MRLLLLFCFALLACQPAAAQKRIAGEWAWRPLLTHEGVEFLYLFYREADSTNNGVVVRVKNTNDFAIRYRFTILFRSGEDQAEAFTEGTVAAKAQITGDRDGLFWIPFEDGRQIGEIGLRGFRVTRVR